MEHSAITEAFWSRFLKETGRDKPLRYTDCFHFDNTESYPFSWDMPVIFEDFELVYTRR